ncbi:hypothetical protein GRAN_0360 [Granulicella sibirica]|uniref:Uncharacterized protein n=1 Tax=Granulicella sibirica TaxID=2479048 RepID=A0A4Q0T3J3_9BACT|nr:hypothetical protein GRAN_0360 [Granulicella sibirica]
MEHFQALMVARRGSWMPGGHGSYLRDGEAVAKWGTRL